MPYLGNLPAGRRLRPWSDRAAAFVLLVAALATTAACSGTTAMQDGSTNPAGHSGSVLWRELLTPDPDAARTFYTELFGWTFAEIAPGYEEIRHEGRLIGGMARVARADAASHWVPILSVTDVDAIVTATLAQGGARLVAPFELPGRGRVAILADPKGATFGVVESANEVPLAKSGHDEWLWAELWTDDIDTSEAFYRGLIGYEAGNGLTYGAARRYLMTDERWRAGLHSTRGGHGGAWWLSYVRVDSVNLTLEKVRALAGEVVLAPKLVQGDMDYFGDYAVIRDSVGATLIVRRFCQPSGMKTGRAARRDECEW